VDHGGFAGVYPITEEVLPLEIAMQPALAAANVENTVKKILPTLFQL
jgi:hypothetical protein